MLRILKLTLLPVRERVTSSGSFTTGWLAWPETKGTMPLQEFGNWVKGFAHFNATGLHTTVTPWWKTNFTGHSNNAAGHGTLECHMITKQRIVSKLIQVTQPLSLSQSSFVQVFVFEIAVAVSPLWSSAALML